MTIEGDRIDLQSDRIDLQSDLVSRSAAITDGIKRDVFGERRQSEDERDR